MTEKPNMSFLNNAVDYTIKRIKEAGEKFNSKELKGAIQYEDVLSLMFAFGAQWKKDTDPNKSDYIEICDSVLNECTEVIEKEKKAEEERQKRLEQMKKCGHVFNSFEDSGIDIDGDIIVDEQKYVVDQDTFSWGNKNGKHKKINIPKIPPAEYRETHNKLGTKGVKISILEDTEHENLEPEAEVIISDETIRSRLKAKPDNDLSRKLFAPNASASLRYQLGVMSDEQFKAFMKGKEDEFLNILLGGK